MVFVISAFTGIALITAAIVAAVWLLPQGADAPSVDKDEALSPRQKRLQAVMGVITGVYALLMLPACFMAFAAPFAMTGSGSLQGKTLAFMVMAAFPFTITGSVLVAWILFRRRKTDIALWVSLLPLVHLGVSFFVPGIWSAL